MAAEREFSERTAEELACAAQAGSLEAYEELVRRYQHRLFRFLRRFVRSAGDAEDLVQDTFIRAFRRIHRYKPEYRFVVWLMTIGRRLAARAYRKHCRRDVDLDPDEHRRVEPGPEEQVVARETAGAIWQLAAELPRQQTQVLWLHYAEDFPVKEIARVMGKSCVGVRVMLHRARTGLAQRLRASPDVGPTVPAWGWEPGGETGKGGA